MKFGVNPWWVDLALLPSEIAYGVIPKAVRDEIPVSTGLAAAAVFSAVIWVGVIRAIAKRV